MQMQQMALVIALLAVGMIVLELIKLRRPVPPDYVQQALEQAVDPQRCARFLIRSYTVSYVLLLVAALGVLGDFFLSAPLWLWMTRIGFIAGLVCMLATRLLQRRF